MVAIVRPLVACVGLMLLSSAASGQNAGQNVGQNTAQTGAAPPLTTSLRDLGTLLARVPESSPAISFNRRRAATTLARLQALSTNWPAESPADYRANLAKEVAALAAAIDKGNLVSLGSTVEAIAEDLEIKLEHCTKSGGKLGGSVVVKVRTVRAGDEVKNWEVLYMPRIFEAAPNASPDRFPRLSSPTNESLVPGTYLMWLKDPSSDRMGPRTTVKVGRGMKELTLDLSIPVDTRR